MASIMECCCVPCGNNLNDVAKGSWLYGPFGCLGDCNDLGEVNCRTLMCVGPCQTGLTNKALGNSFCVGFCCGLFPYTMPCIACMQRGQLRSKRGIGGLLLPGKFAVIEDVCCGLFCTCCTLLQVANETGETATFTNYKISDLLRPPTANEMRAQVRV